MRTQELIDETMRMADESGGFGSFPAALERKDSLEIAEALVEAYLDGAERSDDAAHMQSLQRRAERAISRLAWLRSLTPD